MHTVIKFFWCLQTHSIFCSQPDLTCAIPFNLMKSVVSTLFADSAERKWGINVLLVLKKEVAILPIQAVQCLKRTLWVCQYCISVLANLVLLTEEGWTVWLLFHAFLGPKAVRWMGLQIKHTSLGGTECNFFCVCFIGNKATETSRSSSETTTGG